MLSVPPGGTSISSDQFPLLFLILSFVTPLSPLSFAPSWESVTVCESVVGAPLLIETVGWAGAWRSSFAVTEA